MEAVKSLTVSFFNLDIIGLFLYKQFVYKNIAVSENFCLFFSFFCV